MRYDCLTEFKDEEFRRLTGVRGFILKYLNIDDPANSIFYSSEYFSKKRPAT